jgi:hypothetical protein
MVGEHGGDKLGRGIAGGADLNGDGIDDVVAGAWQANTGEDSTGLAYILYGPLSGKTPLSFFTPSLLGDGEEDRCCQEISLADLNGDDQADIILGSEYLNTTPWIESGAVHVFFTPLGRRFIGNRQLSEADITIVGATSDDQVGKSIDIADLDGDGLNDLAVGAFKVDPSIIFVDAGQVSLFYGGGPLGTTTADDADARFVGDNSGDRAGEGVASGGDLNGDGRPDLVVSARLHDSIDENEGKIYVIQGDGYAGLRQLSAVGDYIIGERRNAKIGRSMAIVPSWDDTDFDWLVLGADTDGGNGPESGAIYFIPGPIEGTLDLSTVERVLRGENPGDHAGYSIADVGDVDRDGWHDVLISAYEHDGINSDSGKVYLIYGTDL